MISPMKIVRMQQDVRLIHLAVQVGVAEGYLSRIENGWKVAPLRLKLKISRALNCTIEQLWPQPEPETRSNPSVLLGEDHLTLERLHFREESRPSPDSRIQDLAKMAKRINESKTQKVGT